MNPSPPPLDPSLPADISRALAQVGARMNAWVALDATLAGVATGAGVGVLFGAVARLEHVPLGWALAAGSTAALAVGAREARARWVDAFGAAATLDRLLHAKDRFVSALHFTIAPDRSSLHALQLAEAASFLGRFDRTPAPPRPSLRFPRFVAVAAVVALASFATPFARSAIAHLVARPAAFAAPHAADNPAAIAARAAALREALRDSPNRRIDAEINALERALNEQAAHAEARRTEAIERAAAALDRAHASESAGADTQANHGLGADAGTTEAADPATARDERARAEATLASLQSEVRRAVARVEESQRTGDATEQAAATRQLADVRTRLAQTEAQRDNAARREQLPAPTLDAAVSHLDRALQATEGTERSALPSDREGHALDAASREIGQQLPETAGAMREAARAREANDGQRVNEALERARASLAREAHAEPDDVRRARQALEALHDQVADNAARQRDGERADPNGANDRANPSNAGTRTSLDREQEALRNGSPSERSQGSQPSSEGERDSHGQEQGRDGDQARTGQPGQGERPGQNGQPGPTAQPGQGQQPGPPSGQPGEAGRPGQFGRRGESGQGQQGPQGAQRAAQGAWREAAMAAPGSANGPMGPSMSAPSGGPQARGAADPSARGANTGNNIGDNRGNSQGNGLSQGNRTATMGGTGSQTVTRFDRGQGETESDGRNQMTGNGPGQAHGSAGASSGGAQGGSGTERTEGGHAFGSGTGERLSVAAPTSTGPFGRSVDPGGSPAQQAQLAPDARGVMMPGVAQQGAPTGPTSEAPVAPGSLLPNAPGDGVLAGALDEDPESAMTTQRVPASLRAYVRRYFQRLHGDAPAQRPQ